MAAKARRDSQRVLELHYSIDQVAAALAVHKNTVRAWIEDGSLGPAVQAGLVVRIPASAVNRWLDEHTVAAS